MAVSTPEREAGATSGKPRVRPARRRRRAGGIPPARGLWILVVGLGVWQLVMPASSPYAPPPSVWGQQLGQLWSGGTLGTAIVQTVETFFIALAIAIVLGIAIGALVGRSRTTDRTLGPLFEFFRVMPAAAIVPLVVLFVGFTLEMRLIVVVFTAIWPILLQVRSAARGMDQVLFDTSRVMRLGKLAALRKVLLPSLVPSIMLGIRVATPTVLIIVILVELITGVSGLGGLIEKSQQAFNAGAVYGLLAVIGAIAVLVNTLIAGIEAYLLRYRPS